MRVLLVKPTVHPPTIAGSDVAELEPLELEYLATALRDHDVQLFDERFDGDLTAALQRFQPNVVAVTAYSVHYDGALAMLRTAKGLDARVFTVVGGHHATVLPADFQRSEVDAIVCGEGAFTLAELLRQIERGAPPAPLPGLWYGRCGGVTPSWPAHSDPRDHSAPRPTAR